jgi:hypothetical protein
MDAADQAEAETLNTVVHRRAAYRVNAPVLVRHVCYRDEKVASWKEDSGPAAVKRMNEFIESLNLALRDVHRLCKLETLSLFKLHAHYPESSQGDANEGEGSRKLPHESLLIALKNLPSPLDSWRVRLRVDIHAEYYSLTFIFDLPRPFDETARRYRDLASAQAVKAFQDSLSREPVAPELYEDFIEAAYGRIWDKVDCFFKKVRWPGVDFTQFRGAALDINRASESGTGPLVGDWTAEARIAFRRSRQLIRERLNVNSAFFRALLQIKEPDTPLEPDPDVNCVLCEVLDGNAVYGSSLGKQVDQSSNQPLRYFVICDALPPYQLGRLLRRLHVLGELRHAALLDLTKLHRAGIEIRALSNWINKRQNPDPSAAEQVASPGEQVTSPAAKDAPYAAKDASRGSKDTSQRPAREKIDFAELQKHLHKIAYDPKPNRGIAGGLPYRVNRSRSYAQAFKNRVIELRVQRLEGWEPYDLFVQRTLYQEFNFIDGIGRRYEAMEARVQRLTQAQHLHELEIVEREIKYILAIGEIIGWTAFAYYASQILAKIAVHYCPDPSTASFVCLYRHVDADPQFAATLIALGVALALGLGFRVLKRVANKKHLIGWSRRAVDRLRRRRATATKRG